MQLNPRESFVITHQLNNSYITETSYVRAVIRNAKTDVILATKDLDDKGDGRFTTTYQIPADGSGQGFYISIVTSVYTDSGYTTKSQNYGDEVNTYLVQDRPNINLGGMGGGGGPDIDYKRIKKIIDDAIAGIKFPEAKVITVTNETVKEVMVPEIKIVETQKVQDLSPILNAIQTVGKQVEDKEVTEIPEQEEVDFKPVLESINSIGEKLKSSFDSVNEKIDNLKVKVEINNPLMESKVAKEPPKVDPRINRLMMMKNL